MSVELEARVRRANLITRDRHLERLYDDDLSSRLLRDVYFKKEGRMTETTDRPESTTVEEIPRTELALRPATPSRPVRRNPTLVPAILTAVIAIGVIVAVFAREPRPGVADTPVGIAEQFMAALNEYDVDTVMLLFADDVEFLTWPDRAENFPAYLAWQRIMGVTYEIDACIAVTDTHVSCPYVISDSISRAVGVEPGKGSFYLLTIEDGKIDSVNNLFEDGYNDDASAVLDEWMTDNHPDDWSVMENTPYIEPNALALWREHIPEFLANLEDSG